MSNRTPNNKQGNDLPGYDWGNNNPSSLQSEQQPLHPLDKAKQQQQQQSSSSSPSSSLHHQYVRQSQQQQQHGGGGEEINTQTIQQGQEISLINVPIRTMATYTFVRNPMLGASVYGMIAGYGALFHSLLTRAPAKNTFYWGNICVAWKVALIATVYFRGIESDGKPGGTLYKEYVKVEDF